MNTTAQNHAALAAYMAALRNGNLPALRKATTEKFIDFLFHCEKTGQKPTAWKVNEFSKDAIVFITANEPHLYRGALQETPMLFGCEFIIDNDMPFRRVALYAGENGTGAFDLPDPANFPANETA